MFSKKNLIVTLIVVSLLLASFSFSDSVIKTIEVSFNSINITVNNEKVDADTILYDGTTYVPLRAVAEMLGKEVTWTQETMTAGINDKAATPETPVATETSTSVTSRTQPAKLNEKITITHDDFLDGKQVYTLEMLGTITGDEADKIITEANMFNDLAKEGNEIIIARFNIKVVETEKDKPVQFSSVLFDCISEKGIEYTDSYTVSGLEKPMSVDLYPSAEYEGWVCFEVSKEDMKPVIVINRNYDSAAWFELRN